MLREMPKLVIFAKPKKLSEVIISKGKLIWLPYIHLIYKTSKGKVDVLVDSLTPYISNDPLVAVLTARKTKLLNLVSEEPLKSIKLNHRLSGQEIVKKFKEAYAKADELTKKSLNDFYEQSQLDIDWSRYRALLIPSKRLISRKEPIFRYLTGRNETSPYAVGLFLKGIIEKGLKLTDKLDAVIELSEKAYYPLIITSNLDVYEPAWKLSESIIYNWLINEYEEVRDFFNKLL